MIKESIIARGVDGKNRLVFLIKKPKIFGNVFYVTKQNYVSPILKKKEHALEIFNQQIETTE